jgi:hypothetical protein
MHTRSTLLGLRSLAFAQRIRRRNPGTGVTRYLMSVIQRLQVGSGDDGSQIREQHGCRKRILNLNLVEKLVHRCCSVCLAIVG